MAQGQGDVDVFAALFSGGESLGEALFFDIRLPRALAGIIAGGALAAAAVVLQALTRNPLAEPATLGHDRGRRADGHARRRLRVAGAGRADDRGGVRGRRASGRC